MGEHSIITPETRAIDWESGTRVVCQLSRGFTAGGRASSAGGVRRPGKISSSSSSSSSDHAASSTRDVVVVVEPTKGDAKRGLKWRRRPSSRVVVFFASLIGVAASFLRLASGSSSSSSRVRRPLVSSGCCVLVSLLVVVGLLRPTVAVPTGNAAVPAAGASASPIGRRTDDGAAAAAARILPEQRQQQPEAAAKFAESVVDATMRRRRASSTLEERSSDGYDSGMTLQQQQQQQSLQHPRESGLESRSRLREAELDTIRRSIVEGLGLERIPDPSKANVSQTEYRRAHQEYLTRLQSRAGRDERARRLYTFHASERRAAAAAALVNRTRRSALSDPEDLDDAGSHRRYPGSLYFPLEIPEDDALVDHATLRLLVDSSTTSDQSEIQEVSLYRVTRDSRHFVSRQKIPGRDAGPRWLELDATELASLWHEYGVENLGVELQFESANPGRRSPQPRISSPALNVFTSRLTAAEMSRNNEHEHEEHREDEEDDEEEEDARGSRRKRRASPEHLMSLHKGRRTECRGENKKCCRHQMTVIFKDLEGFEFIVQPKSFDAGYCKGRCPPRYNPAHHHALLQSLIWKEDKRKAPRPCCAPSKLDELEILYFDENDPTKLKVSSWKNMKVLECACS